MCTQVCTRAFMRLCVSTASMCVCVSICALVHISAHKGQRLQLPWSWNYKQLYATWHGRWELNYIFCKSGKHSWWLSHLFRTLNWYLAEIKMIIKVYYERFHNMVIYITDKWYLPGDTKWFSRQISTIFYLIESRGKSWPSQLTQKKHLTKFNFSLF